MIDAKQARENVKNFAMEEYAMPLANDLIDALNNEIEHASTIGKPGLRGNYALLSKIGAYWIAEDVARIAKERFLSLGFTVENLSVNQINQHRCLSYDKDGKLYYKFYSDYQMDFSYSISWKE